MNITDVKNATFIVGSKGGELICTDIDGEAIWVLGMLPGLMSGKLVSQLMDCTCQVTMSGEVFARLKTSDRGIAMEYGEGSMASGANPDFQPTKATEAEIRTRRLLQDVDQKSKRLEKRIAAFAQIAEQKSPPVVEGDDDETPPAKAPKEPEEKEPENPAEPAPAE